MTRAAYKRLLAAYAVPALLALAASHAAIARNDAEIASPSRGEALFDGQQTLVGRIRNHDGLMPPSVLACGNCHARHATASTAAPTSNAPALDADALLTATSRRNGPPSAYTRETFCRLLRTGIDPRQVMVSRTMPQFVIDEAACTSLWLSVTARTNS